MRCPTPSHVSRVDYWHCWTGGGSSVPWSEVWASTMTGFAVTCTVMRSAGGLLVKVRAGSQLFADAGVSVAPTILLF